MGATEAFRCLGRRGWVEAEIPAQFFQWTCGLSLMILTLCLRHRIHLFSLDELDGLPPRGFPWPLTRCQPSVVSVITAFPRPFTIVHRTGLVTSSGRLKHEAMRVYVLIEIQARYLTDGELGRDLPFICPFILASWSVPLGDHTRSLVGPLDCLYDPPTTAPLIKHTPGEPPSFCSASLPGLQFTCSPSAV
jgi:hypothetical protein